MGSGTAHGFRLSLPRDGELRMRETVNPLLREALETTDLLRYGRRLWNTGHDRIRVLLELPASRRWLAVTLHAEYAEGRPVTLIEAELVPSPHRLTARELEVLTLVAAGHSNPTIAEALYTSPRTVSTQVETVRGKLGAISRTAAGVMAFQNGWLKLPMPVAPDQLGSLAIADLLRDRPALSVADTGGASRSVPMPRTLRPVRLGLAYPTGGPAQADGTQSIRGAMLAIAEINARGGIRGRKISPVPVQADIYTADGIHDTFAELRALDVDGVLMSYVFDETTVFTEAADLDVPVLHTMTSRRHLEAIVSDGHRFRNVFQCVPPETNYGRGLVRFLGLLDREDAGNGRRTIRFAETAEEGGQIADAETLRLLDENGWEVLGVESLDLDPGAIARLVMTILRDPPEVLVVSEFLPSVLADLLLRLHAADCPSVIYTIYAPSVPEFVAQMGVAAEGLVWSTLSGTYSDPYGAQFRAAYLSRYGVPPGLCQAGLAYDMVHVLANAWQQTSDPTAVENTVAALRATRYRGVNGSYNFASGMQSTIAYPDETNDPSLGNAQLIFQVQDGAHRCIDPVPYADATFRGLHRSNGDDLNPPH